MQQAQAGATQVRCPPLAVVLIPVATIFGLFFLLTGDRFPYRDAERRRVTPVGWVLFALVAVAAFGGHAWMSTRLSGLGYR